MKNKNDVITSDIKIDQLLPERSFIEYCNFDYHRQHKLNINQEFLRAAEADNFLFPLLQRSEVVKQEDGTEKEVTTNYYSPHQIYVVATLSKNQVHEGFLWAHQDLEFHKQQGFRMVNWGWSGYAFNITLEEKDKGLRVVEQRQLGNGCIVAVKDEDDSRKDPSFDHLKVCIDFQNFVILLHSLEQLQYSPTNNRAKDRYFSEAPSLYFDLSPLRTEGNKMLKKYGLDLGKLKILAHNVAGLASDIDPLEHWYYYLNLHPQWRKDLFKGDAALAQEVYRIYDLLIEVIEVISNEKQSPMFELLYGEQNIHPYLIPRTEYVHGTDVKSMWAAIKKFKEWMKLENNKDFVEENTLTSLESFEKELKEYEDKYGARSFISNGVREVEVEENIKLDDLDPKTKQYTRPAQTQVAEGKHQFLSLWGYDLEERIKKQEITLEQAKKEDYDLFIKREVFDAIERRLSSLKRELWAILDTAQKQIARKVNEAWDIEHNFGNNFWFKRKEELNKLSREEQLKLYRAEYKKAHKQAQYWSQKRDEFGEVEYIMNLLFCSVCRQKPVAIHQFHYDEKISSNIICDDCVKNAKDPKTIKQAELKCDYCGAMLYKYAYQNRLNDLLFNKAPADINIELEYGRLQVRIGCKSCKQVNRRWIDWGWVV